MQRMINRKKILVADDDHAIVEATSMILEESGYHVDTTLDGGIVYELKKDFPDLLLLDIWMSGQDGREICKFIKSNEATKNIPVVLISASRDIETSAKEAGADDFIAKPFDMNELLDKVAKYTNN